MTSGLMISLLMVVLLPGFIITIFIPYWTRKTESFGVSIPEEKYHSAKLQKMRKKYVYRMIFISIGHIIILLGLFLITNMPEETFVIVYTATVFLYLMIGFFVYLTFHRQMKVLKQQENWFQKKQQQLFVHTKFREQKLSVSHFLFMIPLVMTLIMIAWTLVNVDLFPDEIPLNYSLTGEVTNWTEKSYLTVLFLPITQFVLTIIFLAVNIVINQAKQQVSATNPEESLQRNIIFRRRWSMFLFATSIALTLMFTIAQISLVYQMDSKILMAVFFVTIVGILGGSLILSISTGQGGSRIKLVSSPQQTVIDRDDDEHWKLGIFYFNKDDPTLFIEKRFGIGWSINFARPTAWIFILAVITFAVGIPLLVS